ncbi:hypothetical protein SISSUDRAFT_306446 [Sistotremastrum suecicum HHB10207 ss-3]|uniref:Pentacotripeptide-repeat region of PRORP domain-containing protein n=1 Tax=Sistotremastrum suecicum HHB10207 ss-3 TaxID=1314776 RepID=A0A166G7V8_9AGAM|nr:hypothetical protein SISSUDRAFT_306446 [Sistotremastrum suecicum HHB10207 ss-3]
MRWSAVSGLKQTLTLASLMSTAPAKFIEGSSSGLGSYLTRKPRRCREGDSIFASGHAMCGHTRFYSSSTATNQPEAGPHPQPRIHKHHADSNHPPTPELPILPVPSESLEKLHDALSKPIQRHKAASLLGDLTSLFKSGSYIFPASKAQSLAESFARSSFPEGARQILLYAFTMGTRFRQFCYENIVHQLAASGAWRHIPPLVTLARQQSLRTTVRLLNWRIRALIESRRFSLLHDTLEDFEQENLRPNRRTYHMLVQGHLLNHDVEHARQCLDWMIDAGFPITSETHAAILRTYKKLGPDVDVESSAYLALRGVGDSTDVSILNGLLESRMAADDFTGVVNFLAMFDFSSSPSEGTSSQIDEWSSEFLWPEGATTAKVDGAFPKAQPNIFTFRAIMNYHTARNEFSRCIAAYNRMVQSGITPDETIAAVLIHAYGSIGDLNRSIFVVSVMCREVPECRLLFERLAEEVLHNADEITTAFGNLRPSPMVFNVLFQELLDRRGLRGLHILFNIMDLMGVTPDERTLNILVSYVRGARILSTPDMVTLIKRLSKYHDLRPTIENLNSVLASVVQQQSEPKRVRGWQRHQGLVRKHKQAVSSSWSSKPTNIPEAHSDTSNITNDSFSTVPRHLESLLDQLQTDGLKSSPATLAIHIRYFAVVKRDMDAALGAFQNLLERGFQPNAYHYAALMEGYALQGDMTSAEQTMQEARTAGVKPNPVLFTILIAGHARRGNPDLASYHFSQMRRAGLQPDIASIDALVSSLYISKQYRKGKEMLMNLWPLVAPFPVHLQQATFLTLVREWRRLRQSKVPRSQPRGRMFSNKIDGPRTRSMIRKMGKLARAWRDPAVRLGTMPPVSKRHSTGTVEWKVSGADGGDVSVKKSTTTCNVNEHVSH